MKKGLVVLIVLSLCDISSVLCSRKGRSPAERRVAAKLAKNYKREMVEQAIKSGDVNELRSLIKQADFYSVYNYFRKDDPHGKRALSMAGDLAMKRELEAWGAGEKRSGLRKTKSCPVNIAGLYEGVSSPRARRATLEVPSSSCAVEAAVGMAAIANMIIIDPVAS
jgi:hypothetical protein